MLVVVCTGRPHVALSILLFAQQTRLATAGPAGSALFLLEISQFPLYRLTYRTPSMYSPSYYHLTSVAK